MWYDERIAQLQSPLHLFQAQYCSSLTKLPLVVECARIDVVLSPGRHWMQRMQTELPWESLQPKQQILLKDPCSCIIAQMRSTWRWLRNCCRLYVCLLWMLLFKDCKLIIMSNGVHFYSIEKQWHACSALWIRWNVLFLEWRNNYVKPTDATSVVQSSQRVDATELITVSKTTVKSRLPK